MASCAAMDSQPDRRPSQLLAAGVMALALGAGVLAWVLDRPPRPDLSGVLLDTQRALPSFSLARHDGGRMTRADLEGHWSLLFFGFTHCPDVCPTTLFTLREAMAQMEGERPQVILVSLDPMRDTPEILAAYVPYFHPTFIGLTGELPEVQELADGLGVAYAYVAGEDGDYSVDHTASLFLVDPQGRLAGLFHPPHDAERIARDMTEVMR